MTPDQRVRYAREVIRVLEHRSPGFICTSADFHILAKWMDRDIPLAVVLRGIHDVKVPKSVRYCEAAVNRHIDHWSRALA